MDENLLFAIAFLIADEAEEVDPQVRRIARVDNYVENVIPRYTPEVLQSHFRLSYIQIENLMQRLGPHYIIAAEKRVSLPTFIFSCLWVLANQDSYREVADRFNIAKSTVSNMLREFTRLVCEQLDDEITWPRGAAAEATLQSFSDLGFPNTIGAIDGSYIQIDKPSEPDVQNPDSYYNRKSYYSITLMAVCNTKLKFTYVQAGGPSRLHDARIFRQCSLGVAIEENPQRLFPPNSHIIGDSAFPLSMYLMTPYKDNGHLTRRHRYFNTRISSARAAIERCFRLLKCRFRRLRYLHMHKVEDISYTIKACCILHNICIDNPIDMPEIGVPVNDQDVEDEVAERHNNHNMAVQKRDAIADSFM